MWIYEKKLQYPVNIRRSNPKLAKYIMSQIGGPDGEINAALRYLSQRYTMPIPEGKALLTDIGTEELAHVEVVSAIVRQLTQCADEVELSNCGLGEYYIDHTAGIWPQAAAGAPQTSLMFQSKGDPITDIHENMAAEQKARTTYDNILRLADDPDVKEPLKFLRQREVIHYQRFGELMRILIDRLDARNYYAYNPAFDTHTRVRGAYIGKDAEYVNEAARVCANCGETPCVCSKSAYTRRDSASARVCVSCGEYPCVCTDYARRATDYVRGIDTRARETVAYTRAREASCKREAGPCENGTL